ncbi:MAG TPA: heparinase II/III family protein, partial [Longimicrobiaceae bacterium]|nr:heparinase II/III family protein [Longimicrobiaceae bacterium]
GPGWEPYPTALRAVSWMRARLLFGAALPAEFGARLDGSLHRQLAFLRRRLEWHILANHLQKDLHALVLGGLYFGGADAAEWRTGPLALLWRELSEQVLGDGGHFERSPMYHSVALGDFLELLALLDACDVAVPPEARERVARMAAAWVRLSRPDGRPHLFNDAAEDGAADAAWLARLAELAIGGMPARPRGSWVLPETGYAGYEGADGDRIIVDCGAPGPRYQPGHAHCDALSFELDLGSRPVVVDSGTSGYDGDPLRAYARSTRAHSTVEIGVREQSEVWGTFRVVRMARVRMVQAPEEGAAEFAFAGECIPFHDRRAVHRRRIARQGDAWRVEDAVDGAAGAPLRSFVHLHPRFEPRVEGSTVIASAGEEQVAIATWGADRVRLARGEEAPAQGWYSPRFGERTPAPVVVLEIERNDGRGFGYELRPR